MLDGLFAIDEIESASPVDGREQLFRSKKVEPCAPSTSIEKYLTPMAS
jgi:hypothetical protein